VVGVVAVTLPFRRYLMTQMFKGTIKPKQVFAKKCLRKQKRPTHAQPHTILSGKSPISKESKVNSLFPVTLLDLLVPHSNIHRAIPDDHDKHNASARKHRIVRRVERELQ